jgi:hypothetical protein
MRHKVVAEERVETMAAAASDGSRERVMNEEKVTNEDQNFMVGSRVLAKWRAPEGGAHGRKKWFEGTVQLVKPNGKFYVVYDDGDSEDDVLQWNLQLLVDLTRDTSYEVPREKHVQMRKPSNHDRAAVRNSADASAATVTVPCGSAAVM